MSLIQNIYGHLFVNNNITGDTLTLSSITNDDSLTQILARNSGTGFIEYRDVDSIISAATSADTYVTGFTYDNANTFTISDNSGSTFNATINTVTGLTVNGNLSATTVSACTGIYTSNLYGCSPITVHDNLTMVDDSIIKAVNGDGVLNLRFNSTNNVVQLDNDGGTYNRGWFFLEDARMQAGYQNNYYEAESNNLRMRLGTATTSRYLSGDADEIQLGENIPLSSDGNPFKVFRTDGGVVTLANSAGFKVLH